MLLVAGLGNPGPEYVETRHNIGFRVVELWAGQRAWRFEADGRLEALVARGRFAGRDVVLLKPQTFMNRSGRAVARAVAALALEEPGDLLVVYDDLDLPFGRLRLRPGGGAGGHRGLRDIQEVLGRDDFPRLRVGIGRPDPAEDAIDYVLSPFSPDQSVRLGSTLERCIGAIEDVARNGVPAAMNRVNAPPAEANEVTQESDDD